MVGVNNAVIDECCATRGWKCWIHVEQSEVLLVVLGGQRGMFVNLRGLCSKSSISLSMTVSRRDGNSLCSAVTLNKPEFIIRLVVV